MPLFCLSKYERRERHVSKDQDETVCLLTRQKVKEHLNVDVDMKGLKHERLPPKPTYKQIQAYVLEKYGLKVSPLYIANVKGELGLEKQFSYEKEGIVAKNRPQCSKDKLDAVIKAFKHFKMISSKIEHSMRKEWRKRDG